jgi:ferredoxin
MEPATGPARFRVGIGRNRPLALREREPMPIVVSEHRLRVNPIACDAFGYCAELVPEVVQRDEWGYPIIGDDPVPPRLFELAKRAVRECPRRALFLEKIAAPKP